MATIVISEFMDQSAVGELALDFDVLYDPALVDDPPALRDALSEARALIVRNRTRVSADLITAAPKLVAVGRLGVGLDNIDLEACERRDIAVLPATGANNLSVAEYVIAGLFMLLRRAYHSTADVAAGSWPRNDLIGGEVSGKRLGLVGFGGIAKDVAVRARALGMNVVTTDPYVDANDGVWAEHRVSNLPLDALLESVDALSLHVPLTSTTRHLIDQSALAKMQAHAVVINAARGGVVDEDALVDALIDGRLGGAMLDVFENEPLAENAKFAAAPNLILTPHIAGVTKESNTRVSLLTAKNVREALG